MTVQLTEKQRKQLHLLVQQWLELEKVWEQIDAAILEKAKKINRVIPLAQLTQLSDVNLNESPKIHEHAG